jgi:hypothetical protein
MSYLLVAGVLLSNIRLQSMAQCPVGKSRQPGVKLIQHFSFLTDYVSPGKALSGTHFLWSTLGQAPGLTTVESPARSNASACLDLSTVMEKKSFI